MTKYKIYWLDYPSKYSKSDYPHSKNMGGYGGDPEIEAWDWIEAENDIEAFKKAIRYGIGVNAVFTLYKGKKEIATEEDMDEIYQLLK